MHIYYICFFRDDFEEQCDLVDIEVPDIECKEVRIKLFKEPQHLIWLTINSHWCIKYTNVISKLFHKPFCQALQKECRPVTKKIETETWVEFKTILGLNRTCSVNSFLL